MSETNAHLTKLSTFKSLLLLAPVFFVWVEIGLPIIVAPLFGQNVQRAFIYSFLGYGIYLIYTYLLIVYTMRAAPHMHTHISKKLLYIAYTVLSIIILAGLHAGTMIYIGLSA